MSTTDNMKIAIIGGGLSGLSCSIILERFGLSPTIFESKNQVGGRFVNGEAMMSILSRPIQDPIKYLSDEHGIFLKPISSIRKLTFHSLNEKAVLQDSLGFTHMGQNLRQKNTFQIEGYIAGRCGSPRIGNTIFTGNCLGTFMPAFGYGQFPAMLSGIYAAWELCGIASYENSLNIRRVVEQLSDIQLDMLMKLVDTPVFQNMYRSKYFNFPRLAAHLLKPLARLSPNANK